MTRELDRIRFVTRHFNDLQGLRYWVPLGLITLSLGGATYFQRGAFVLLRLGLFAAAVLLSFGASRYYRHAFGEVEPLPLEPGLEVEPIPVYSPAGPPPRLEGFQQVSGGARHFAMVISLVFVAFFIAQMLTPIVQIEVDESLAQPPWRTLRSVVLYPEPPAAGAHLSTPSTTRATFGMGLYTLYGAFFLGLWLWRERRRSQGYQLVFALLLLGLAALGTYLGSFLPETGHMPAPVLFLLPAVAHLWIALLLCGLTMIAAGLLDHWQLVRGLREVHA
jgi:hypothetical protein